MNLLVVEDEIKTAHILKMGLEESGYRVDVAYDGMAGLLLSRSSMYHAIISDIVMPKLGGIEMCKRIRAESVVPILLLTALDSKKDVIEGLDAGADDYLTKPFNFGELLARLRVLTKRQSISATELSLLHFADLKMNILSKEVSRSDIAIELTVKEFNLLEYFVRRPRVVVSRTELAKEIWNIDFNTGTNIVEVYINYLRNKVDKPFANKLIHNIHGAGYVLKEI